MGASMAKLRPRSPCAMFHSQPKYCSYHGRSSPYFAFMLSRISCGIPLSPVKGPPGMAFMSRNVRKMTRSSTGTVTRIRRIVNLTTEELLSSVWGDGYKNDKEILWVTISRLRSKLEEDPSNPVHIVTRTGMGYTMPNLTE